jgi:galactokinase/mevalonate kinase-like predicted kinase/very-short-patch-repair endonuclease
VPIIPVKENGMIIVQTPMRISFFGGGSDYPEYFLKNSGAVLNTTINKYGYITLRYLPPFFEHKYRVVWSQIENVQKIDEINHSGVRNCLKFMGVDRGVEIHYDGDLPARSGLGTSSAFTVGLLNAIHALHSKPIEKLDLALEAIDVEQNWKREVVGVQDQLAAACLPAKTKILTTGIQHIGVKDIEKIEVGDKVLTFNEVTSAKEWDIVTKVYSRETSEIYKLGFSNGNKLEITAEHPVFVIGEGWVLVKDLKIGDEVIQKRYPALGFRLWDFKMVGENRAPITRLQWANPIQRQLKIDGIKKNCAENKDRVRRVLLEARKVQQIMLREDADYYARVNSKRSLTCIKTLNEPLIKAKIGLSSKRNWAKWSASATEEQREKRFAKCMDNLSKISDIGNGSRMSSLERKVSYILRSLCPRDFKFNRKGIVLKIGNKVPDFVNVNGKKKLIEVFGNYWHTKDEEVARANLFRKYGWDTLFIWEDEFKEIAKIKQKIKTYLYNPDIDIVQINNIEKMECKKAVYNLETERNHNYFAFGILVHNCGGLNFMKFGKGKPEVTRLELSKDRIAELESHLLLVFTGFPHTASEVAGTYNFNKDYELKGLTKMAYDATKILQDGGIIQFGELLNEAWEFKKKLSSQISSPYIDYIYEKAIKNGAIGGKILGAGGGGFMLLFVEPEKRLQVKEALGNLLFVPFHFESEGTRVIYNDGG